MMITTSLGDLLVLAVPAFKLPPRHIMYFNFNFRFTILRKWKEGNRHLSTYRRLIQALFDAGAVDSVRTLCQELGAPQRVSAHPTPSQTTQHSYQHPQGTSQVSEQVWLIW